MCYAAPSLELRPILSDLMDCSPAAPLSMGSSRQKYWSGLPCPPPGSLPDPGVNFVSPALAGGFFTWEALIVL